MNQAILPLHVALYGQQVAPFGAVLPTTLNRGAVTLFNSPSREDRIL